MGRTKNNGATSVVAKSQMNYVANMYQKLAERIDANSTLHAIGMHFEECFDPRLSYQNSDFISHPSQKYVRLVMGRFIPSNETIEEMRQEYPAMPDLRNLPSGC